MIPRREKGERKMEKREGEREREDRETGRVRGRRIDKTKTETGNTRGENRTQRIKEGERGGDETVRGERGEEEKERREGHGTE